MPAVLETFRRQHRLVRLALGAVAGFLLVGLIAVAVLAPDALLGLVGLAAYVVGVLLFSAAITLLVVRISPSQSAKEQSGKA